MNKDIENKIKKRMEENLKSEDFRGGFNKEQQNDSFEFDREFDKSVLELATNDDIDNFLNEHFTKK